MLEKTKISFTKMSGAGNDFVVVDNRFGIIRNAREFAKAICDRKWGVGADGILLLENSSRAAFTMQYFNADGSYGGMCGNGGRCISRFALLHQVTSEPSFSFEALDYIYTARTEDGGVQLAMKNPANIMLRQTMLLEGKEIHYHYVDTGSPHCVIFLCENMHAFTPALSNLDVENIGKKIRNLDLFFKTEGVNVNFIQINSENSLSIRTYERGVEAETLACGTGSIASAVISYATKQTTIPCYVRTKSGEELKVSFKDNEGKITDVTLFGSARVMFEGSIVFDWTTNKITS